MAKHLFQKGQSGNPGGRPKGFAHKLREKYGDTVPFLEEVERIAKSKKAPESVKLKAIEMLWDRMYGKPAQLVGGDPENTTPITMRVMFGGRYRPQSDDSNG